MVSSSGDQAEIKAEFAAPFPSPNARNSWATQYDAEQIFRLIDSILPFEACLYHQILPLSLEGSRLKLGMVNLDDAAALDYVRRILAYMNCSLVPQTLASPIHHAALSAYLKYTGQKQSATSELKNDPQTLVQPSEKKLIQPPADTPAKSDPKPSIAPKPSVGRDPNSSPTLLVDSLEDLNFQDIELANPQAPPPTILDAPDTAPPLNAVESTNDLFPAPLLPNADVPSAGEAPPEIPSPGESLPILEVTPQHLSDPVEVLLTLPPPQLLQELLGRVLVGGIGRLYLERQPGSERHPNAGRILWSQNGVLQSVLEELPGETLQGVINELKQLTRLPSVPVQKPKQVEVERLYQRHRLLLRLRVMPGAHGEEATVQVLRGAALKFYQQQQLASLSRDALVIAQELQRKVNEIRVRTRFYPMLTADQLDILPSLDKVLKSVESQLEALKTLQLGEAQSGEEDGISDSQM
jgi:hypothetical protein